jgi:hypothetical protein
VILEEEVAVIVHDVQALVGRTGVREVEGVGIIRGAAKAPLSIGLSLDDLPTLGVQLPEW